jgi:maleylacetoacetate isomerase
MPDLVLHHYWRSSSSWRVRWALAIKGVPWRGEAVDLLSGAQSSAGFVDKSPMGYVPCLMVDGRPLSESMAILGWLEDAFPTPALLPAEPWARARARQLAEMVNAGVQPIQNLAVNRKVSSDPAAQRAWAAHWIERGFTAIERDLELIAREGLGGRHAIGDQVTIAELYLIPQLYNARRYAVELSPFPRLLAVEAAALATEAAQASHPDRFQPAG